MEIIKVKNDSLIPKWNWVLQLTENIVTWTSENELSILAEYASRASFICEIGSYHGKSALVMALANPNAKICCIDNFENEGCEEVFRKNLAPQIASGQLHVFKGTSTLLQQEPCIGWEKYDVSFIDGGHLRHDLVEDISNLLPRMAVGSVMTGHDWRPNNPNDGVNLGILDKFKREKLTINESLWAVQL